MATPGSEVFHRNRFNPLGRNPAAPVADAGMTPVPEYAATRVDGAHVLVELRGDDTHDQVLGAVVDLGLALIRVEPRRSSLEDLFRDSAPPGPAEETAA